MAIQVIILIKFLDIFRYSYTTLQSIGTKPMLYSFLNPITANILAFFTALTIMLTCGKNFIALMHSWQHDGQPIRECGPQSHLSKKGTPTMGGILILAAISMTILLYADLSTPETWICLGVIAVFGTAGFFDDYIKVKRHTPDAMTAKIKLLIQFAAAAGIAGFAVLRYPEPINFSTIIPYFNMPLNLWYIYIPFLMIVIAGTSNAVNLSDGLDGLASGLLLPPFTVFMVIALGSIIVYETPVDLFSIGVVCSAVIGACLGFLWFNSSPAQIFMGDTGSLALGALLGTIAVMLKQELLLAIIGIVFVIEALSVMLQVFWYKKTKTRIFKMAPIHHHFEQSGWKETTVVSRFRIIGWIAAILGLLTMILPSFGMWFGE